MKKIDKTSMEQIEGGLLNCFTVGLLLPLSWGMGPSGNIIQNLASYCWDS